MIKDEVGRLDMAAAAEYMVEKEEAKKRGRKKGSKNSVEPVVGLSKQRELQHASDMEKISTKRRTLATREIFDAVVAKYGCPIEAMAAIGFDSKVDVDIRLAALKEFASYGHAKLKTIEHTGPDGEPLEVKKTIINNILQLVQPQQETTGTIIDASTDS